MMEEEDSSGRVSILSGRALGEVSEDVRRTHVPRELAAGKSE